MKQAESLEYEQMKKKALEQLRSGKSLYGKDGAFAPLLKSFLDAALEAELESHLDAAERSSGNRKMYAPLTARFRLIRPVTATPVLSPS
jgi:putative transposase